MKGRRLRQYFELSPYFWRVYSRRLRDGNLHVNVPMIRLGRGSSTIKDEKYDENKLKGVGMKRLKNFLFLPVRLFT